MLVRSPDAGAYRMMGREKMKAARQQAIVNLLIQHKSLTTEALAAQLHVSKETIRRDLSELQIQGKVLRNHGRAKYIHRENQDCGDPFHMRLKSHFAHKADIAREALAWIDAGMVIALDASSTCWYLARQLPDIDLQVFTNIPWVAVHGLVLYYLWREDALSGRRACEAVLSPDCIKKSIQQARIGIGQWRLAQHRLAAFGGGSRHPQTVAQPARTAILCG